MRYYFSALQRYKGYTFESAYHTVADEEGWAGHADDVQKMGILFVEFLAVKLRSMIPPDNRSSLTSYSLKPPSTAWPPFVPLAPIVSSRPRQHALILAWPIQSRPSCKEPAIDRYTYGVHISPVPLLKVFKSRIFDPP